MGSPLSRKTEETAMTIRRMTIEDYDSVYALWLRCAGMGLNNIDDSRSGIEKFLLRNPDTCYVAVEQDQVVGVILAGNDGRRGYIYHTAVAPRCRHSGIGRQLAEASMNSLKELGIIKVCLVAFARNEEGNAFWESLGFKERTDLTYRDYTLVEMERIDT